MLKIELSQAAVDAYLTEHRVESSTPVEAVLAQMGVTASGQPVILIAFDIDGKKHVAFTTLQLMETACAAVRAASGVPRSP